MVKYPFDVEVKLCFLKYLIEIVGKTNRARYLIKQIYSLQFHLLSLDQCITLYRARSLAEQMEIESQDRNQV